MNIQIRKESEFPRSLKVFWTGYWYKMKKYDWGNIQKWQGQTFQILKCITGCNHHRKALYLLSRYKQGEICQLVFSKPGFRVSSTPEGQSGIYLNQQSAIVDQWFLSNSKRKEKNRVTGFSSPWLYILKLIGFSHMEVALYVKAVPGSVMIWVLNHIDTVGHNRKTHSYVKSYVFYVPMWFHFKVVISGQSLFWITRK